jgi:hypothetical protein
VRIWVRNILISVLNVTGINSKYFIGAKTKVTIVHRHWSRKWPTGNNSHNKLRAPCTITKNNFMRFMNNSPAVNMISRHEFRIMLIIEMNFVAAVHKDVNSSRKVNMKLRTVPIIPVIPFTAVHRKERIGVMTLLHLFLSALQFLILHPEKRSRKS